MEPIVYIINLENSNYRPHAQEWGGGGGLCNAVETSSLSISIKGLKYSLPWD